MQVALDVASQREQEALVRETSGYVLPMIACPYANYVAQKIIEIMSAEHTVFMFKEFEGFVDYVARHRFGCRIIKQLIDHSSDRPECAALVEEVLASVDALVCHKFAHHVIECIVESSSDERQRHRVFEALSQNPSWKALSSKPSQASAASCAALPRHATFVVLKALMYCSYDDAHSLAKLLMKYIDRVSETEHGCNLYRELCTLPRFKDKALAELRRRALQLRNHPDGQRLLSKFTLDASEQLVPILEPCAQAASPSLTRPLLDRCCRAVGQRAAS